MATGNDGGEDPLVKELQKLAATDYPLCAEAKLLLDMAVEAQQGKSVDVKRLRMRKHQGKCNICGRWLLADGSCPKTWSDGEGGHEHD